MPFITEFYRQPKVKPLALALIAAAAAEGASLHDLEEAYTVVIQEYRHVIKKSGEIITQFRGEVEGCFERSEKEFEAFRRRRTGIAGGGAMEKGGDNMEDNRYFYSTRTIRQFEAWRKDWEKTGETDIFKKIRHVIEFQGMAPEAKLEIIHYLAQQKIMAESDERTERQKQAYMNALLGKGADGENA